MSIKISFKKNINNKLIKNYVLFTDQDFKIRNFNQLSLGVSSNIIDKTIKSSVTKNKDFICFNLNSEQKIILIKLKNQTEKDQVFIATDAYLCAF